MDGGSAQSDFPGLNGFQILQSHLFRFSSLFFSGGKQFLGKGCQHAAEGQQDDRRHNVKQRMHIGEIGRASCRERGYSSVVAVRFKKKSRKRWERVSSGINRRSRDSTRYEP